MVCHTHNLIRTPQMPTRRRQHDAIPLQIRLVECPHRQVDAVLVLGAPEQEAATSLAEAAVVARRRVVRPQRRVGGELDGAVGNVVYAEDERARVLAALLALAR